MFHWTAYLKGGWRKDHPVAHSPVAVAVNHKVYSFGWSKWADQIGVHIFNTVSLDWMKLPRVTTGSPKVPSLRVDHTAVLVGDVIYIWGGDQRAKCNRLYAFDVDTHRWLKTKVYGAIPDGRSNHAACVLGKVMYVYGGISHQTYTSDIFKLDTTTMVWSSCHPRGIPPPAPAYHSATIIGTKMFVFGGYGSGTHYNHVSVFDTETNSWLEKNKGIHPEGCWHHSAFTYKGELYIFGGRNTTQTFSDLWKFNPVAFCWKKVEPKGKRMPGKYGMHCCLVGDRLIIMGGYYSEYNNRMSYYARSDDLLVLDMSPSLKTLCKLAVIQYSLEQSELPHNVRWDLAAMTANNNR